LKSLDFYCKSTKFVSRSLWTCARLAYLLGLILQPSVASTLYLYEHYPLFSNFRLETRPQLVVVSGLSVETPWMLGFRPQLVVSGLSVRIPLTVGFRPQLVVVSGLSVGIPLTVGFRPQLVVVSGLSVGIPLTVWFRPQLVVASGLSVGIPLTVGFRLSRSLWLSRSPFHETFLPLLTSWLPQSLFHELFLMMGFRLSQSLFTKFTFTRWNYGYHGAFHKLFFLTMEFRLSQSLSRTFLSHNGISAITETFTNFSFS
jgi:hypothetical protein